MKTFRCVPLFLPPDDEATKKKIRVEIKPVVPNGSGGGGGKGGGASGTGGSVDELQKAVGGLELMPMPVSAICYLSRKKRKSYFVALRETDVCSLACALARR